MSNWASVLAEVAGVATALVTLTGIGGWFVWPRLRDQLEVIIAEHATKAGQGLPELVTKVDKVISTQKEDASWRTGVERRLGSMEQIFVRLLQKELRDRLEDNDSVTTVFDAVNTPDL